MAVLHIHLKPTPAGGAAIARRRASEMLLLNHGPAKLKLGERAKVWFKRGHTKVAPVSS